MIWRASSSTTTDASLPAADSHAAGRAPDARRHARSFATIFHAETSYVLLR